MSGIYCISSYERFMHGIYLVYTWYILFLISIFQVYTWYMTFLIGIYQVYIYTRLVLWRRTWPHAAIATSNHITGPCHYCNSVRFATFAHFTIAHVNVYCPFRHKERQKTPFFARTAHKLSQSDPFGSVQITYKGRDSVSLIGRKLPNIHPGLGATTVVAF
jgi:hypothetical protein